jgi:MerR family mercuric resistance operon transcriptional regulator
MPKTAAHGASASRSLTVPNGPVTIGGLARAAEVGVETVRYYQRRRLLAVPHSGGGFRRYPVAMVERIRFIKRSQNLGFSLEEIRELLRLEDGGKRKAIRGVANSRLKNIREKIRDLERMEGVLAQLVHDCEEANVSVPCPIIAALSDA